MGRQPPAPTTRRRRPIALALLLVAIAWTTPASAKRKDDRLVLVNGDHIVGEIKKLEHGELWFKADYVLDTFQVDWARVQELESQDMFHVLLKNGQHFTGAIARHADGRFTIAAPDAPAIVWSDVVGMLPDEASIWAQLTGQLTSGFSYTSGDSQTQFSSSGSLGYVADRYAFDLSGSSTFSGQEDGSSTRRNTADLTNQFTLRPKWFAATLLGLLNSDQQDLDLRTTAGAGIGRWLVRTERTGLSSFGGLVYTHERYTTDSTTTDSQSADNLEGVLALWFSLYRFKTTTIDARLTLYPSLSSAGRLRVSAAPTLNLEIARNLYWSFTLYENYDSQPPVNANKNDFGVTNSLGWKF
jgi:putative salt-induced outer membrane protein YdiY